MNRYGEADFDIYMHDVTREIAEENLNNEQDLVEMTTLKARVVLEKLESDTVKRFRDTLHVLRCCRLLGYAFVKETTLGALEEDMDFIQYLPIAGTLLDGLRAELRTCQNLADNFYAEDPDGSLFWKRYFNKLLLWYKVAAEVALLYTS